MRNQLLPMFFFRLRKWRFHQFEIGGFSFIGQNIKIVLVMFYGIFQIFFPFLEEFPFRKNIISWDKSMLIRNRRRTHDKNILQRFGFENTYIKGFVFFMENQNIFFLRRSYLVPKNLKCTKTFIFSDVEKMLIIIRPDYFPCGVFYRFQEVFFLF